MRYNVTIQETLASTLQIEASSQKEAELAVDRLYRNGDIVLSADNYLTTKIAVDKRLPFYKSLSNDFTLIQGDCVETLSKFKFGFDMVFADPPYDHPRFGEIPGLILNSAAAKPGALVIVEHSSKFDFSDMPEFTEKREYGSVNFSFFRKKQQEQ